jgi:hypothetical protein
MPGETDDFMAVCILTKHDVHHRKGTTCIVMPSPFASKHLSLYLFASPHCIILQLSQKVRISMRSVVVQGAAWSHSHLFSIKIDRKHKQEVWVIKASQLSPLAKLVFLLRWSC